MRITPNIDATLLKEAKALAASEGITLSKLVEKGLSMQLQAEQVSEVKAKQLLPASASSARPSISELFGIAPNYERKAR